MFPVSDTRTETLAFVLILRGQNVAHFCYSLLWFCGQIGITLDSGLGYRSSLLWVTSLSHFPRCSLCQLL